MDVVATLALSKRWEDRLMACASAPRATGAVVITGFLGAGKTTLVNHLIAASMGTLRLGVLVNEVGGIDVDSQLLNANQSNAAVGLTSVDLAGGCACCTVHGQLETALQQMVASAAANGSPLDYLVLEASGAADAAPLAAALAAAGFRLDAVVAVIDAEAGLQALAEPLAQAQVRAADLVVLNKCDLASLGAVADVEDVAQKLAPGVKLLRSRFGQVPLEAVLDIDPPPSAVAAPTPSPGQQQQQQPESSATLPPTSVVGEVGFLSHEGAVSSSAPGHRAQGARPKAQPRSLQQQAQHSGVRGAGGPHGHSHHHNHMQVQSLSVVSSEPLCMACFQRVVACDVLKAPGLLRAKGVLFFAQRRRGRFVFHVSGKQRAECRQEGVWEEPPAVRLVLIGLPGEALPSLALRIQSTTASSCACAHGADAAGCDGGGAAERLTALVASHERLAVCAPPSTIGCGEDAGASVAGQRVEAAFSSARGGLVEFSVVGSPLHGVLAEEVNALVMRAVNAAASLFLCATSAPPMLSAATGYQHADRSVSSLLVCLPRGAEAEQADAVWASVLAAAAPVLRKAFAHVTSCKCDVAAAAVAERA